MTKEELIEFIQKLPDKAFLHLDRATFTVLDTHLKPVGLQGHLMAIKEPTIKHDLKFSIAFETSDRYFPDLYRDKTKGFYKDLFCK